MHLFEYEVHAPHPETRPGAKSMFSVMFQDQAIAFTARPWVLLCKRLILYAVQSQCSVCVCTHTHVYNCEDITGVIFTIIYDPNLNCPKI